MPSKNRQRGPRSKNSFGRSTERIPIRQRFLIVSEGTKTEPNYFEGFRMPTVAVRTVGIAQSPIQIVDEAIRLRDEANKTGSAYDQVWSVFDRDRWTIDDFNNAFNKARAKDIQIAYSNEAFELWFLLHFEYCNTATPRTGFAKRLNNYLDEEYAKNSTEMHNALRPHMDTAMKNAERLLAQYSPPNPATDNPSTTVHLLVKELLRFSR